MKLCPCGSQNQFLNCCGIYISAKELAPTPEALMRSRYTAYTLADVAYIKKTMRAEALKEFHESEAANWAQSVFWLKLKIINSGFHSEDKGFVEFKATFMDQNYVKSIHEISQFQCIEGCWYYTKGELLEEPPLLLGRNTPCPCNSKKKFKNCHGRV